MSIRAQLSKSLLVALCVTMAILLTIIYWGVGRLTKEYVHSRLQHDAETIITAFSLNAETQQWELTPDRVDQVYNRVYSGHYFVIQADGLEVRSRSLWDYQADIPSLYKDPQALITGPVNQSLLVWNQQFSKGSVSFTLWVAEDIAPIEALKLRYSLWAVFVMLCGAALLLYLQHKIITRSFCRLDAVREKIQAFKYSQEKPDLTTLPKELTPLAQDIDQLLMQLQKKVSRTRYALGNLAHEIKRPLQRVQQIIELSQDSQSLELKKLLEDIQWLIQRELKRARIVGVSTPGRETRLSEDIAPLVDVLTKLYSHIQITTQYPVNLILRQDRDDMLELLGNLLDNACKFAKSRVELSITTQENDVIMTIQDDGPGLKPDHLARLMQRGQRLDERVQGAGLGLSICQDIVENYAGALMLENQNHGGIVVTIRLPLV